MEDDPFKDLAAQEFEVEGVKLLSAPLGGFRMDQLTVVKPMAEIDAYRRLFERFDRPRIVELGVAYGGSVALHSLLADPTAFAAFELARDRVEILDDFIEAQGLGDRVKVSYGVDQSDVDTLREAVSRDVGDEIDLVIDDASHLFHPSVASFDLLFPMLRPGGEYVIEDWQCDHRIRTTLEKGLSDPDGPLHPWALNVMAGRVTSDNDGEPAQSDVAAASLGSDVKPPGPPLSLMAVLLLLALAEGAAGIADVSIGPYWIGVTRDDAELSGSYGLCDRARDHFGLLAR